MMVEKLTLAACVKRLDRINSGGPLNPAEAIALVQAYAALHAAHSQRQIWEELTAIRDSLDLLTDRQAMSG